MGLFGSLIGGVTSLLGGNSSSKAAKKAAQAQVQAAQLGVDEQRRQFDITQQNFEPYLAAGTSALGEISALLGLGNDGAEQANAIGALKATPLYANLYRHGQESLLSNASATGGLRGGNTQGALYNLGEDTLTSLIQQQLSNLGGIANMGMGSAGQLGTFGQSSSNSISNLLTQQGQARAGGILGSARAQNQMFQDLGTSLSGILGGLGVKL